MATKKTTGKASKAPAMPYEMRDFDALEYDIGHLAERAVLKHPQVQKRIEKMKQKLSKTANGHKGITAERAQEAEPKTNGAGISAEAKLKGPGQVVRTRMPRQDKLPTPKVTKRKGSKTSY